MISNLFFKFIVLLALCAAWPVNAATIEQKFDLTMGCDILVSGEIIEGDAKKLEKLIGRIDYEEKIYINNVRSPQHKRVCFNSSGGSFLEALEIAQALLVKEKGSAIGKDMICESACALAFLAGSKNPYNSLPRGVNKSLDRVIHPLGRLGFHSPKLVVDNDVFDKDSVEAAYDLALETLYKLYELKSIKFGSRQPKEGDFFEYSYLISDRLLRDILATKPQEMRYLKTIGDASDWGINIAPINFLSAANGLKSLSYVCDNTRRLMYQFRSVGIFQEPFLYGYILKELDVGNVSQDFLDLSYDDVRSVKLFFKLDGPSSYSCDLGALSVDKLDSFGVLGLARTQDNEGNAHLMHVYPFHMLSPEIEINSLPYLQDKVASRGKAQNILISIIEEITQNIQ